MKHVRRLLEEGGHDAEWMKAMEHVEKNFDADKQDPEEEELPAEIHSDSIRRINPWWIAAAAVVLMASVSLIIFRRDVIEKKAVLYSSEQQPADSGHKWLKLADGTSVQLNDKSHLNYPRSFAGKRIREVRLEGEAFFDVKHDPSTPFIIQTGKIRITVLGTAFNVKAYKPGESVVVTVSSGRVKVEENKRVLALLSADQQLSWKTGMSQTPGIVPVKAEEITAWKNQDLIMDDITMEEAAQLISERFGVQVVFAGDAIKKCRFTAAFLNKNNLEQVLTVLESITGGRLNLNKGIVTIDGPAC